MKRFGYTNRCRPRKLTKIVVNMGVGDAIQNIKAARRGRRASWARSPARSPRCARRKKSIANFKLREGQPIGCMVTLRGARMYEFYDRLVNVAIPRIRDFRGVPTRSFDGRGNYTLGLTEQIIFPEINYDKVEKIRGMDVTFVTSAQTDEEGRELLAAHEHALPPASDGAGIRRTSWPRSRSIEKWKRTPKFKVRALQPLPPLRPAARLPAGFRPVPHLLPRAGAHGADPGRRQGELVSRTAAEAPA